MREELGDKLPLVKLRVVIKDALDKLLIEIFWVHTGAHGLDSLTLIVRDLGRKLSIKLAWELSLIEKNDLSFLFNRLILYIVLLYNWTSNLCSTADIAAYCGRTDWRNLRMLCMILFLETEDPLSYGANLKGGDQHLNIGKLSHHRLMLAWLNTIQGPDYCDHIILLLVFINCLVRWIMMLLITDEDMVQ